MFIIIKIQFPHNYILLILSAVAGKYLDHHFAMVAQFKIEVINST